MAKERKRAKNIMVSFCKRRKGLLHKAKQLCTKFDAQVAFFVVSQANNTFAFAHPSVDHLLRRRHLRSADGSGAEDSSGERRRKRKARELELGEEIMARVRVYGENNIENCESVEFLEGLKAKYLDLLRKVRLGNKNDESFGTTSSSGVDEDNQNQRLGNDNDGGQENDVALYKYNGGGDEDSLCWASPDDFGVGEGFDFSTVNEDNFKLVCCNDGDNNQNQQNYMSFWCSSLGEVSASTEEDVFDFINDTDCDIKGNDTSYLTADDYDFHFDYTTTLAHQF